MRTFLQRTLALALAICCLPACGAFDFHGQDLALRHDEAADTFDLKLHYRGVTAPKVITTKTDASTGEVTGGMDSVCELIEDIAGGKRYFMLMSNLIAVDLDKFEGDLAAKPSAKTAPILAMMQSISVEQASVSLDTSGHIVIDQILHLHGAAAAMEQLNNALHQALLDQHAAGSFAEDTKNTLDDKTRLAFIAEARAKVTWISWSGSDLVFSLPITPESSARLLQEVLDELGSIENAHDRTYIPTFFHLLSSYEHKDGRLVLTLGAGEDGYLTLSLKQEEREYSKTLLEALSARNFSFNKQ